MLDFNLDVDANGTVRDRTEPLDPTVVRLTDDGRG